MSAKKISQAEARRYKLMAEALMAQDERRRNAYTREYPGGVNIATLNSTDDASEAVREIKTARLLGHPVVAVNAGGGILFYAVK